MPTNPLNYVVDKTCFRDGLDILRKVSKENRFPKTYASHDNKVYYTDVTDKEVVNEESRSLLLESKWTVVDGFWAFTGFN